MSVFHFGIRSPPEVDLVGEEQIESFECEGMAYILQHTPAYESSEFCVRLRTFIVHAPDLGPWELYVLKSRPLCSISEAVTSLLPSH